MLFLFLNINREKLMKYLITIVLSFGCFVLANASELPPSVSAEYFGCKLDDKKDLNDLNNWVKKWNRWMDSSDLGDYEASLLTPLYRSPNDELDFMWVGRTNSWRELARGQSAYRSSGLADTFPAKSCPFSFIARQIPVNGTDFRDQMNQDEFVAAYWLCKIEERYCCCITMTLQEEKCLEDPMTQADGADMEVRNGINMRFKVIHHHVKHLMNTTHSCTYLYSDIASHRFVSPKNKSSSFILLAVFVGLL